MPKIFKIQIENISLLKYNIEKGGHNIPKLSSGGIMEIKRDIYLQKLINVNAPQWVLCQNYHSDRSARSISDTALATAQTKVTGFPENSNPCHPYDLESLTTNIQSNRMA